MTRADFKKAWQVARAEYRVRYLVDYEDNRQVWRHYAHATRNRWQVSSEAVDLADNCLLHRRRADNPHNHRSTPERLKVERFFRKFPCPL